jgi:hypothetical protein
MLDKSKLNAIRNNIILDLQINQSLTTKQIVMLKRIVNKRFDEGILKYEVI